MASDISDEMAPIPQASWEDTDEVWAVVRWFSDKGQFTRVGKMQKVLPRC